MFKTAVRLLTFVALVLATVLVLGSVPGFSASGNGPYVQIIRLEASRSLGNGRLADYLRSTDRMLAMRAALAIGRTKQADGVALLRPLVTSPDAGMRAMAVYGNGLIAAPPAAPLALRALHDPSPVVRISALDATDRLENANRFGAEESAAERATQRLLGDSDMVVRARAATALESFSTGGSAHAAQSALAAAFPRENEPFVRWHIMWSLYRGYAMRAPLKIFSSGLRDRDEVVRIEAVRAVGRRGDRAAVPLLTPLLADPSWRVREQTLESLIVLRGGTMTAHLTAIPHAVRTPAPAPDPFASIKALARTPVRGKPGPPEAASAIVQPHLDPTSVALFTGPARGPHPRVRIVTTKGNLYVQLFPEWAPLTVENFLNLTNRGYYDNNPWFRIVPDFVVQTGDPTGNGNGDAGYTIPAEENPIEQDSYVISMGLNYTNPPNAHAIRDSAGTQFYITLSPQLHLDSDFTVFGRVVAGYDVLGRLIESDRIVRVERLPDS